MKRQQLLRGTIALGVGTLVLGPVAALLDGIEPAPIPAHIGATDIEQIHVAARVFTDGEASYGGGFARNAALAQLSWSADLLKAACPDRLRPELFSAVGDLADTAGYLALDTGAYEEAHQVFDFALGCAERAEDWHLRATVLSDMALQAIRTGRPDEGLTLAEHALVRADRLTATERAMLHNDRARALAKMRRIQETLAAIGAADEHFAHSTPAYMAFYDTAMHTPGLPGKRCSTWRYWAATPARPLTGSLRRLPGTPSARSAPGRSPRPSWPASPWPLVTRSRPPPSVSWRWMPSAPFAPAEPSTTFGNSTATPPVRDHVIVSCVRGPGGRRTSSPRNRW